MHSFVNVHDVNVGNSLIQFPKPSYASRYSKNWHDDLLLN